jgi:catechol 2,3-dioxygenase-like lactoylglutathione lyase family enzyme
VSRRRQLPLNVNDLDEAITFFSRLFGALAGQEQAWLRKLRHRRALAQAGADREPRLGGSLNQPGVEVPDTDTVEAEQARLAATEPAAAEERGTLCCYGRQDKFWIQGAPDGESWEIYTVLADSPTFYGD